MRDSLRPDIYSAIICTLTPAILALTLRIHARVTRRVQLSYDDYLAMVALVSMLVFDVSMFFLVHHGMGLHIKDVRTPAADLERYILVCDIVQEVAYFVAIGLCQLSLLALYWRLFKSTRWAKVTIVVLAVLTIAWLITFNLLAVLQCQPLSYYWDKSIKGKCTLKPTSIYIGSIATQYTVDIALIALPAIQIQDLVLPRARKFAVMGMFMFGVLICASGAMVLVVSTQYKAAAEDITWNFTKPAMWASVEMHLSMIACCLPVLRPVLRRVFGWVGWSVMSTKKNAISNSTRLRTTQRSQVRAKIGDSTENLAGDLGDGRVHAKQPGGVEGERMTSMEASSTERRLSEVEIEGIRVGYEVNVDLISGDS